MAGRARGQEHAAASSPRGSELGLGLRLATAAAARGTDEYAGTRHPLLEAANSIAINKQRHKNQRTDLGKRCLGG